MIRGMSAENTLAPFRLYESPVTPGRFELVLYDGDMEKVEDIFHALGAEGHGHGWNWLAWSTAKSEMPDLFDKLMFESEAGTFVVLSDDLDALQRLAGMLHAAFHDRALLADRIRASQPPSAA